MSDFSAINWDVLHATQIIMAVFTAINVFLIKKTCD